MVRAAELVCAVTGADPEGAEVTADADAPWTVVDADPSGWVVVSVAFWVCGVTVAEPGGCEVVWTAELVWEITDTDPTG